jgi:hypothetical protein
VDDAEGLLESVLLRDQREVLLHPLAHHEHDLVDAGHAVEARPRVGHDRAAGNFEKQRVHVRAHAFALTSGDDDGGNHSSGF